MAYCTKCGNKIEEGANFCPICGAQQNGQYELYSNMVNPNHNVARLEKCINEAVAIIGNIFVKPISTIADAGESEETGVPVILTGILAIVYGLMQMWVAKIQQNSYSSLLNIYTSLPGNNGIFNNVVSDVSYGKVFIKSFLAIIILIMTLFVINYIAASYFMRADYKPKSLFRVIVCSFVPFISGVILQVLFNYIYPVIGYIFYVAGVILSLFLIYKGINNVLHADEDKTIYLVLVSSIISSVIFILIMNH